MGHNSLYVHNPGVQADPASWDQLVPCPPEKYSAQTEVSQPMGCAHTKIMRPWFVRNLYFSGAGYELIPGGRISSYPWVVRMQKNMRPLFVTSIYFSGAGYEFPC